MKKNILIIGLGEVGKAIYNLEKKAKNNIFISELNMAPSNNINIDVAHVCIPYDKRFINTILKYLNTYNPHLTIIHSTVKVGSSRLIYKKSKRLISHSPIMGVHPHLTKSVQTFKKIIGGTSLNASIKTKSHLISLGIKTETFNNSDESEACKIFSTSYYGLCIAYMKEIHKYCEENNLDFGNVYTEMNNVYNKGYAKMGKKNVIRPILKYMKGPTGGHCILPNLKLIKKDIKLAKKILELENEK